MLQKINLSYHNAAPPVFFSSSFNFLAKLKWGGWAALVLGSCTKPKIGAKYSVTSNVKILEVQNSFCSKQCSFVPTVQKQNK